VSSVIVTFLSVSRRLQSETVQSKLIRIPEKEKSIVKIEDLKAAFLHCFGNFVSPLMKSAVGQKFVMNLKRMVFFVKKPMRVGIVGSRSAP
jgi:hypothetical protein